MHKAHADRVALAEGIKRAQLHQNMKMERDELLGSSMYGHLGTEAHNTLGELTRFLNTR